MSEQSGGTGVAVSRAWVEEGEDGSVHVVFTANGEDVQVKLQRSRNPRLYEFIVKHAELSSAPEQADDDTDDDHAPLNTQFN